MKKTKQLFAYAAMATLALSVVSCDMGDDDNTANPAEIEVAATKGASNSGNAILLCSFGSTFEESIKTYDATIADFQEVFPDYDIYMSFTSRTCVNRVEAALGTPRYQPDLWLNAIGDAGYKNVIVQSLHVIPGEEYLSLMNTDVKKNFMIANYPDINVIKGDCLLEAIGEDSSTDAVAEILVDAYSDVFKEKNQLVLFMGHGNPDENYAANNKYLDIEEAIKGKLTNDNVIVGTVDYGATVFWPWEGVSYPADKDEVLTNLEYNNCVYAEVLNYCAAQDIETSELTITLVPFMTVAGDHAHNDLWGVGEDLLEVNTDPDGDASWKAMLEAMGCKISDHESHGTSTSTCEIKGLCDYQSIRDLWINRLVALVDSDEWENGMDYQLE
ncbi:MAG: sirohydrochlorin cobaltochelatase [Rikenellaceae bacterium]